MAKKTQTQKQKESEAKTKKMKAGAKATRKELVKKRNIIIENFSNSNNEVLLPPLEREIYFVLKATL
jgi:hypothetical protein